MTLAPHCAAAEARQGFKTKLIRQESAKEPVPDPPPRLFGKVRYDTPVGKLAAYLSPDPQDGKWFVTTGQSPTWLSPRRN